MIYNRFHSYPFYSRAEKINLYSCSGEKPGFSACSLTNLNGQAHFMHAWIFRTLVPDTFFSSIPNPILVLVNSRAPVSSLKRDLKSFPDSHPGPFRPSQGLALRWFREWGLKHLEPELLSKSLLKCLVSCTLWALATHSWLLDEKGSLGGSMQLPKLLLFQGHLVFPLQPTTVSSGYYLAGKKDGPYNLMGTQT